MKRFILGSLVVGAGLVATRCLFAKPASSEPASNGRSLDVASYDEVDAYVEGEMCRLNIPGVSLAIVEGDQLGHLRGFGRARPDGEAPTP
jgi:hypothetical protein